MDVLFTVMITDIVKLNMTKSEKTEKKLEYQRESISYIISSPCMGTNCMKGFYVTSNESRVLDSSSSFIYNTHIERHRRTNVGELGNRVY